jgi:hypothetical protein
MLVHHTHLAPRRTDSSAKLIERGAQKQPVARLKSCEDRVLTAPAPLRCSPVLAERPMRAATTEPPALPALEIAQLPILPAPSS